MGSRNQPSTLPTRLKHVQTPATRATRTTLMLPLGANSGEEAHGRARTGIWGTKAGPFPPHCQAPATPTALQQGWTFIPPLPRTSRRQGTYHSAKPRKKQAALTVSMCVRRPLINSFFPLLPSALLWATKSNSAALRACTEAATHLSDP